MKEGRKMKYPDDFQINRALIIAAKAHEEQYRKKSTTPYIIHPFEVAMILKENNGDEKMIIAGLLHDTLEDTSLGEDDIRKEFGEEVLQLVIGASEILENRKNTPWDIRKKHTIDYAKDAPKRIKLIICADKYSNIKSMVMDYHEIGNRLWDKFNAPYEKQRWYYQSLVDSFKDLEGHKVYKDFKEAVKILFDKEQSL